MSTYFTMSGEINYPTQEAFNKVMALIGSNEDSIGWIDTEGYFLDEGDERISEFPDVDFKNRQIVIPMFCYRNLGRNIEQILENGIGYIVWASTDGMFDGGCCKNDGKGFKEKTFSLQEWAKENEIDCDFNNEMDEDDFEKMNNIVDSFMEVDWSKESIE